MMVLLFYTFMEGYTNFGMVSGREMRSHHNAIRSKTHLYFMLSVLQLFLL